MLKKVWQGALAAAMIASLTACGLSPAQTRHPATEAFGYTATGSAATYTSPITLDGAANYAAIERVIREAKTSVSIETFNFYNDPVNMPLCDLLVQRQREGIKVRVLIDHIGNYFQANSKNGIVAYLKNRGVDARVYDWHSMAKGINLTHRKLYLADGNRGLTGGMNLTQEFHDVRHDMLVEFNGDNVAQALHREFALDWHAAGGDAIAAPSDPVRQTPNQVVVTSPGENRFEIREALLNALAAASESIEVESPYLSYDGLIDGLMAARKRGVKVRIIAPGANNSPIFKRLNTTAANQLLREGAEIRSYTERYTHVKYFSVDGKWTMFGSANGDSRAMNLNQELSVIVRDPALLQDMDAKLFEADWAKSTPVMHFVERPWYDWPFTSLLELVDYYI